MFVKVTNGQVEKFPYTIGDLRRDNPKTSFPKQVPEALLSEYGVYPATIDSKPSFDGRSQRLAQDALPQNTAKGWVIGWTVVEKTAEQVQEYDDKTAKAVRTQRDRLLAETDWLVIMHTEKGTNIPAEWELYRQALRDITSQEGFPFSVEWPTKPE